MNVAIRLLLTVSLLAFMWAGHSWALYLIVTGLCAANEINKIVVTRLQNKHRSLS